MIGKMYRSIRYRIRNLLRSERKETVEENTSASEHAANVAPVDAANELPEISGKKGDTGKTEERNRRPSSRRRRRKPKQEWDISSFQVEPTHGKSRFHDFDLPEPIMHAVFDLQFKYCTPVQAKALPIVLQERDIVARASTGTGKTAVFLIAIISKLLALEQQERKCGRPRALIIAPTRELVVQIAKDGRNLSKYTSLQIYPVFGGVNYRAQMKDIQEKQCDVMVATPGRLLDYLGKNILTLDFCETMIIDEADRMLDMGFIPDVRRIIHRIPQGMRKQTMLFSATVTDEVRRLAAQWCKEPVSIEIESEQMTVANVEQIVYLVTTEEKYDVLYNMVMKNPARRFLIFTNQKNEAGKLSNRLKRNSITCNLLTGDVPQQLRTQRLEEFRSGKVWVLVATDVAGRGIHVEDVPFVVNFTLPYEPEDYVHRIGRTGRAGAAGTSVSFACEEGAFYLPQIEEYIGRKLECVVPDEELFVRAPKQGPDVQEPGDGRPRKGNRSRKKRRS